VPPCTAVYSRTRGHIRVHIYTCMCTRECTSHPSQVGCRGMSSEEFSRAPLEAAVKPECAFATATDFFVRANGDRPLRFRSAENTLARFLRFSVPRLRTSRRIISRRRSRLRRETRFPDAAISWDHAEECRTFVQSMKKCSSREISIEIKSSKQSDCINCIGAKSSSSCSDGSRSYMGLYMLR